MSRATNILSADVESGLAARRTDEGDNHMQFLLLLYEDESRFRQGYDPNEIAAYRAFRKEHESAIQAGHQLKMTGTAKTVRIREEKWLTTDGPFAETKEQLGGFFLIEARDQEEAVSMAFKIPAARSGCIEVRPVV